MKDRFKTKDWETLRRLPILMFQFVSLADQQLQEEEVHSFVTELHQATAYKDPLHRELFLDLVQPAVFKPTFDAVMGQVTGSVAAIEKQFTSSKKILKKKLNTEEYHRFLTSLIGTGMKIATSAGTGPSNVAPEEMAAISVFVAKFDVDVEAGKAALDRL